MLVLVAIIAGSLIYKGLENILLVEKLGSYPNQKLYVTNDILTLIYEAESDARSYYLFRKKQDLDNYVFKLNEMNKYINLSFILCADNMQQLKALQNIRELSSRQQGIIHKLMAIDHKNQLDLIYQRALDEVYMQAYDIMPANQLIVKNTIIRHDSIAQPREKSNFFGRIKSIFSGSNNNQDKSNNIHDEQIVTYDTVVQSKPIPDSLVKIMKSTLDKLKMRDNNLKAEVISTETELLHSDRVILNKIREIVSSLQSEELKISADNINKSKDIISKTTTNIIWLSAISFLLIIVFLILIYGDITRNKHYNHMLESAKRNSDELVRVKEQFLAMMSHEIRTPLSSIIGFSEQLDRTDLSEKQKQYLGRIRRSSDFLLNLVNDTLDLLRINAGKIQLETIRFNLADIIRDVFNNFILTAREKSIEFTLDYDKETDNDVYGDPLRLRQVLINLTGNAIKFTDKGSVRIIAKSNGMDGEKLKTTISFIDTGIGISEEKLSLIFEEFVQAEGSVTRRYGGSGLGLSIASKIVNLYGGKIEVKSIQGKGSTFSVHIDFKIDPSPDVKYEDKELNNIKQSIRNKKILVVDDDETLLLLISSILNNLEISSETALSGHEALNKISGNNYDLIFTDLNMPEMNGFELISKIKTINPDLPVVCITANSVIDNNVLNTEYVSYLHKPFKEIDLIKKIAGELFPDKKTILDKNKFNSTSHPTDKEINKPYMLDEIIDFVGNEPATVKKIVQSFVSNTLITINEMQEILPSGNFELLSGKAHKLLPMFKQFRISGITAKLEQLEQYKKLALKEKELTEITETVIKDSLGIIKLIEYEVIN